MLQASNDVIKDVASRKGVKRATQDPAGEETFAKQVESLRVRDWVLLFFKTRQEFPAILGKR